jgi:hypothetical protein
MLSTVTSIQTDWRRAAGRFAIGWATAVILLAAVAEGYLRWFPPKDVHQYLGESSPLTGVYKTDPDFTITYTDWEAFHAENSDRLAEHLPLSSRPDGKPLWAFFGNSFVQAPGMLADTARARLPNHRIFNLGKNEHLPLRFAQIKLLLESGFRPDHLFFSFMPVDVIGVGTQPLATHVVTSQGALVYDLPHQAAPLQALLQNSRLALTACVRAGWQKGNPRFRFGNYVYTGLKEPLRSDLQYLFGNLARLTRKHSIPVTVLLIPSYYQIQKGKSYGFQDDLRAMLQQEGLDVFDPRDGYTNQPDPEGMFIPDRHFSPRGNQILLTELLKHMERRSTLRVAARPGGAP